MPNFKIKSLPNLISLGRLLLVPAIIVMIEKQSWAGAFAIFVLAGVSDAIDGWIARSYHLESELGAYLDPLADKALLVSIYMALAVTGVLPAAIAILVAARDLCIIGAILLASTIGKPLKIRPLLISKVNTAGQITLAALVLATKAFALPAGLWLDITLYGVAGLTLVSMASYCKDWIGHMEY